MLSFSPAADSGADSTSAFQVKEQQSKASSRRKFVYSSDFLFRTESESAKNTSTTKISLVLLSSLLAMSLLAVLLNQLLSISPFRILVFVVSISYLLLLILKLTIVYASVTSASADSSLDASSCPISSALPIVSAFIPLYKETDLIPQLIEAMRRMEYPQNKFDVMFILESTDIETRRALESADLQKNFRIVIVPDTFPKTKPKALNVALLQAKGDVLVIYDAEIIPDTDQVRKAAAMLQRHPETHYLHARMDHYNAGYNWLTKLFCAEFCFFYNFFLPGVVRLNLPLPISGHSTYFRRASIEIVGGWDPYNVAEDCDIGIRLFRRGFGSGMMLDSYSWEQATSTIHTWIRQRTRWVQGFLMTSIVHLRHPLALKRELGGWWHFLWFFILVPGNVVINILNLFQWSVMVLWFFTHSSYIEQAFGGITSSIALFSGIVGNFVFMYFNMLGLYYRKHYTLLQYALFSFVYWILLGYATLRASLHLLLYPHYWDKTAHQNFLPLLHDTKVS